MTSERHDSPAGVNANDAPASDAPSHVVGIDFGTLSGRDHGVEAADWTVWHLTGVDVRNACTAGSKAVRQDGRYPDEEYLSALDPGFGGFVRAKVERPVAELGDRVGSLTAEAAGWTGLPEGFAVYTPDADAAAAYDDLYVGYEVLHVRRQAVRT